MVGNILNAILDKYLVNFVYGYVLINQSAQPFTQQSYTFQNV